MPPKSPMGRHKPRRVSAIAILTLISGLLNCLLGLVWLVGFIGVVSGGESGWLVSLPIGAFCIVVGIKELVYAAVILPGSALVDKPAKHVAVMEIVNIASGSLWSFVIGILALIFYSDPEVVDWFSARHSESATDSASSPTHEA